MKISGDSAHNIIRRLDPTDIISNDFGKKRGETFTYGGDTYCVEDLKDEDICIKRIARSLSREARYLGHTGGDPTSNTNAYSVAQHAVRGSEALLMVGMVRESYEFLHHDDAEAYMSDVSAPLKKILKDVLDPIEEKLEKKLAEYFGVRYPYKDVLNIVDKNMAIEEMVLLMEGDAISEYNTDAISGRKPDGINRINVAECFDFWDANKAMRMYLLQHERLRILMTRMGIW